MQININFPTRPRTFRQGLSNIAFNIETDRVIRACKALRNLLNAYNSRPTQGHKMAVIRQVMKLEKMGIGTLEVHMNLASPFILETSLDLEFIGRVANLTVS